MLRGLVAGLLAALASGVKAAALYVPTLPASSCWYEHDPGDGTRYITNQEDHASCWPANALGSYDVNALAARVTEIENYLENESPGGGGPVEGGSYLLPPLSIEDATIIGGSILMVWVIAYGVRAMIQLFYGRE